MDHLRVGVLSALAIGTILLCVLAPRPAAAHGGGIDAYGGHRDNKAGNYHAHQGSCAGQTFSSKEAAIKAGCKR